VDRAAEVMRKLGGEVTERLYPNMDHAVNRDEIDFVRQMIKAAL
jgi:predicted esterase